MPEFEGLREARRDIADLAESHFRSLREFRAPGQVWFKLSWDEALEDKKIRHKSTTASCLESLSDVTSRDRKQARALIDEIAPPFAAAALAQPDKEWESEDAAWVYCRVRTLPAIFQFAPKEVTTQKQRVGELLSYAWATVTPEERRQGIYERPELEEKETDEKQKPSYPPNAFHTFWALRTLHMCESKPGLAAFAVPLRRKRDIAVLWSQSMLASQVALHVAASDRRDPNQLAWALISQFVDPADPAEPAASEFSRRDLYKAALKALFEQQLPNGTLPLGQPLFHYPRAGNAYCYTYETLTELLRPALYEKEGLLLRELLLPHFDDLMEAFAFARRSSRVLDASDAFGWSSGHHPHRTAPEGWATAAVFSFVECLRRLVGRWTHEAAAETLGARRPRVPARRDGSVDALATLAERGDTWRREDQWSVAEQLAALFLHPRKAAVASTEPLEAFDPDRPLIHGEEARSAILYGPPGTSKTTVVEALAAAIGWDFVAISASDFLSRGMDHVPARADEIFDKLMELDHVVVLFDEIDELLRERQVAETDPFGRFLTTSMLPKVAQLWKQQRVLFFVATNDIRHADRAIKRSQRFDAAIFVPPPSLSAKLGELREQLGGAQHTPRVKLEDVEDALTKNAEQNPLGYLALLRFDQLAELAVKIQENGRTRRDLERILGEMGEQLNMADWQVSADAQGEQDDAFSRFRQQREVERRDYGRCQLVRAEGKRKAPAKSAFTTFLLGDDFSYWKIGPTSRRPPTSVKSGNVELVADGLLQYRTQPKTSG